jgi:hypothetical protein
MLHRDAISSPRTSLPDGLLAFRSPERIAHPDSLELLTARLEAAGTALLGLQVKGIRPAGFRSNMPEVVHTLEESYGWEELTEADLPIPVPSARSITAMDEALAWVQAAIPLDTARPGSGLKHAYHGGAVLRRLVLARSLVDPRTGRNVFSWRRLAKVFHCSPESARQWHARGLDLILAHLRRQRIAR